MLVLHNSMLFLAVLGSDDSGGLIALSAERRRTTCSFLERALSGPDGKSGVDGGT